MEEGLMINDLGARVNRIEDILSSIAAGDMDARINTEVEDDFSGVEEAVDLLINDLTDELQQREKTQNELEERLATIQEQQKTILQQQDDLLELSSPVTKVWDNVVVLPVIGTLDSRRTQIMMENLLQKIVDTGCTIAILDITGVATIDTQVANHLIKTVTAARLLGAECIVSGISPAIAQTIVHLGIDLSTIQTRATLQESMQYAFRRNNQHVVEMVPEESFSHGESK